MFMEVDAVESKDMELGKGDGKLTTISVRSMGGVISTLTSIVSPANDEDWLDEWLALMHGVLV